MSKLICIDCDRSELRIVVGSSGLTGVAVDQCFSEALNIPVDEDLLDSEAFAETLKSTLQKHGLRTGQAIVTIPRSFVELRTIQVPSTDKNELPEMVRFAAQRHFANAGDNWPIDFLVLGTPNEGMSEVMAASINPSRIERVQKLLEASGLKLQQLVLRPMVASAVALLKRPEIKERPALFVDRIGAELDMAVVDGKHVVFMRSIRLDPELEPSQYSKTLANEIKRTLLSAVSQNSTLQVSQIFLWGTAAEWDLITDVVEGQLKLPIQTIDPLELVDAKNIASKIPANRGKYAAAIGGLLAPTFHHDLIDFAHPRKREEKKTPVLKYALAGTAAALLIGLPIVSYYSKISALNAEIAQLNATIAENTPLVKTANEKVAEWGKIQAFLDGNINWLDQLAFISEKALTPEQIVFRDMRFEVSTQSQGVITSKFVTAQQDTAAKLQDALRADNIAIANKQISGNNQVTKGYPWASELALSIVGHKAEDPLKAKPAKQPGETTSAPASTDGSVDKGGDAAQVNVAKEEVAETVEASGQGKEPTSSQPSAPSEGNAPAEVKGADSTSTPVDSNAEVSEQTTAPESSSTESDTTPASSDDVSSDNVNKESGGSQTSSEPPMTESEVPAITTQNQDVPVQSAKEAQ